MTIHVGHGEAVVNKALIGVRDRYHVDVEHGPDLRVQGNFVDHVYEIEVDVGRVAEVSKLGLGPATPTGWRSSQAAIPLSWSP